MSDQFKVAVERALYGGVLTGAAAGLAAYSQTGHVKPSALAAGTALVAYLLARGGVEGYVDTQKAKA